MDSRPLRFLTVANVPPDPNSGAAGTVFHTNVALRELGHDVDEIWAEQLGPRRIKHGNLHALLEQPRAYRREVMKAVNRSHYDVVLMSQPQAYLAARALKQARFRGVVVNRSHGVELRADEVLARWHRTLGARHSRSRVLSAVLRRLLQNHWFEASTTVDGVVVPSEMDRESVVTRCPSVRRVRVVHHGVLQKAGRPPKMTRERLNRALYVGQFSFIKGPSILARIANRFLAETNFKLTWVTQRSSFDEIVLQLTDVAKSLTRFEDWRSQEALAPVLDEHGIFMFPSLMEGAGKAALEAMARGLCVVASDTGGMRDYIQDGVNGRLVEVGDVDGFVRAIREIQADPQRAAMMSAAAARTAGQKTWKRCAQGIVDFCRELRLPTTRRPRVIVDSRADSYNRWHEHRKREEGRESSAEPKLATWHRMVVPRLGEIRGLHVAEVGCGRGDFARFLAEKGARVTALDFSPQAIEIAKDRSELRYGDIDWRVGDAMATPFHDDSFDLVVSCECLEHVDRPQRMANELYRICKPGGRVLLTTPSYFNGQLIAWAHSWITRRPYNSGSGTQPHENFFVYLGVKAMLRRAGFRIGEVDSSIYQFLLLPRVAPSRLNVTRFKRPWLNRLFRPMGLHFFYELHKPRR